METMTKFEFEFTVKRYVTEWQKRMRLLDKELVLIFPDGDPHESFALTESVPSYQAARITFRHPDFHPPQIETTSTFDIEVTVVHELLHVASMNIPREAHNHLGGNDQWEAFIELTAQAMVAAKRGEERFGNATQ